jgi:replication factor A1
MHRCIFSFHIKSLKSDVLVRGYIPPKPKSEKYISLTADKYLQKESKNIRNAIFDVEKRSSLGVLMKIKELRAGVSNVELQAEVVQKDEPREVVSKYGKRLTVANITIKDETGTIPMSLWGEDIEKVNVGDKIEVKNGYVSEFRGAPQLSTGKFGKISVVGKGTGTKSDKDEDSEEEEGAPEEPVDEEF